VGVFIQTGPADRGLLSSTSSDAGFSSDKVYRYWLRRVWDRSKPLAVFVLLNPSTADAFKNDPTAARCEAYARRWGCGGYVIVNLFALRSTDPAGLYTHDDPVGPEADRYLRLFAKDAHYLVCGWGNRGTFRERAAAVLKLLGDVGAEPLCLQMTGTGQPQHPLYLRADLFPSRFRLP
jgi:hypothetical protein